MASPTEIVLKGDADTLIELVFRTDVDCLTPLDALYAYSLLDEAVKALTERKASMREQMISAAQSNGELDAKGSFTYELGSGKITAQMRRSVKWDSDKVLAMIKAKGLFPENAGRYVYEVDAKLLEKLVIGGLIAPEEATACAHVKASVALAVKKPAEVTEAIDRIKMRFADE